MPRLGPVLAFLLVLLSGPLLSASRAGAQEVSLNVRPTDELTGAVERVRTDTTGTASLSPELLGSFRRMMSVSVEGEVGRPVIPVRAVAVAKRDGEVVSQVVSSPFGIRTGGDVQHPRGFGDDEWLAAEWFPPSEWKVTGVSHPEGLYLTSADRLAAEVDVTEGGAVLAVALMPARPEAREQIACSPAVIEFARRE